MIEQSGKRAISRSGQCLAAMYRSLGSEPSFGIAQIHIGQMSYIQMDPKWKMISTKVERLI